MTPTLALTLDRVARDWLIDCFPKQDTIIRQSTTAQIRADIARHYEGGWAQFVDDGELNIRCLVLPINREEKR